MDQWLYKPQSRLGTVGILALLTITGIITPLSTDIYTPALPFMVEYLDTTQDMVTLTMLAYFFCFALGMLMFGPISDRLGRKPILLFGALFYLLASFGCSFTPSIEFLIACRVGQGIGAGALCAISTAVVKDCIHVDYREKVLSVLQIMHVVGPVGAPLLGGVILIWFSWREIFLALAVVAIVIFVLTLLMDETLPSEERSQESMIRVFGGLVKVARNPSFTLFLIVCALFAMPFMGYIAAGSYVYIEYFGTTSQVYSYFFAANAAFSVLGPIIYLRICKWVTPRVITTGLLAIGFTMGVLLLFFGSLNVWLFWFLFMIFGLGGSVIRPYSTNILLNQQEHDTGSASSLINFINTGFGCIGMALIMLPWPNYIVGISAIIIGCMVLASLIWFPLINSRFVPKGLQKSRVHY